jgi:putative membrane protein
MPIQDRDRNEITRSVPCSPVMPPLLLNWLLSTLALLLAAYFLPGLEVSGVGAALVAAVVIGLVNASLGLFLKIFTFPLIVLSFGIFWFVINALMLMLAGALVPGFEVRGFFSAFFAALLLSLLNLVLRRLFTPSRPCPPGPDQF